MIEKEEFSLIFQSSFWNKIGDSIVEAPKINNKADFLSDLHKQIRFSTYYPSIPREYIISPKTNNAVRMIPVFERADYCIYFYCIKSIDDYLANEGERVPGTFGGWTLDNGLKQSEDKELEERELDFTLSEVPYSVMGAYNPWAWRKHWKQFQKISYDYVQTEEYELMVQFDIANFYDGIRLNILENQVREAVSKANRTFEVNLLFHFLGNWNRVFEGYGQKSVGLPQDEIGDCSRILANFYLREYDKKVYELCEKHDCKYLRYADDQILFLKDKSKKNYLLTEISKYLYQLGLNINAHKIRYYTPQDFSFYWAFDLFKDMSDENIQDGQKVKGYVDTFFDMKSDVRRTFREDSIMKRLLQANWGNLNADKKHQLESMYLSKDFLSNSQYWYMKTLLEKLNHDECFRELDELVDEIYFNSFHYNLLKFYKKYRTECDLTIIQKRIDNLKISLTNLIQ